jgi:hypothetical protein
MDPWLQKEFLDEVENLLASAPTGLRIDQFGFAVHDFERMVAGELHVVFVRLHVEVRRSLLSIVGIKDWLARP